MSLENILTAAGSTTFVRPYLFLISCNFDGEAVIVDGDSIEQSVLIQSTTLPSTTIGNIEVPYQGRKINIPGDRAAPADIQMTIIYHKNNNIHKKFHDAMSEIQGSFNTSVTTPDLLNNIMKIGVKDPADPTADEFHTYTLTGVIPTSIGAVEVSHETTDALLTFDVTIQYSYHTFSA